MYASRSTVNVPPTTPIPQLMVPPPAQWNAIPPIGLPWKDASTVFRGEEDIGIKYLAKTIAKRPRGSIDKR